MTLTQQQRDLLGASYPLANWLDYLLPISLSPRRAIGVIGRSIGIVGRSINQRNTPPNSGLLHHYDATEISGLDDGDTVSTSIDLEGYEDFVANGDPTYKENVQNGNPVVRADGTDDEFTNAISISQPVDVFIIGTIDTNGYAFSSDNLGDHPHFGWSGSNSQYEMDAGSQLGGLNSEITSFHIWGFIINGTNSSIRRDGSEDGSGDAGPDGFFAPHISI